MFADWTDRIAAGEVPATAPRRPQGVERNVVITEWDWADPKSYLHDVVSTDRRNPTLNANGLMYGSLELSSDYLPVLDPVHNTVSRVPLTVRDPATQPATGPNDGRAVGLLGRRGDLDEQEQRPQSDDRRARDASGSRRRIRPADNPAFCKAGSTHPSAKLFPVNRSGRQLAMYDPKTKKLTHINTCFGTHHLMFAEDANRTLWTSGGGAVVGWLDTKMFDETGDEEKSQGWTALILDTNGNGKRDEYTEPNQPPIRRRIAASTPGSTPWRPRPTARSGDRRSAIPGGIVRLVPGAHPPETALAEYYEPPYNNPKVPVQGFSPRGMDIDRNGVAWVALASGHMASFDRRKCKGPLNGPTATGQHCPEGWTLYAEPLPQLKGVTEPAAPRRATTRGSTSSTRSDSARTRRSTPATRPRRCSRSRTASG